MDSSTLSLLLTLLEKSCVVAVFAYLVVHSHSFREIIEGKFTWKNQAVLILAFGLISVYGTIAGIPVDGGAVANIRDMGPMIGGLIGGPVVGIGAGLIGGIHRYSVGGFTAVTCSTSAVISGALGGAVYLLYRKKFIGIPGTVALCILAVGIDIGLALAFVRPYEDIVNVIRLISLPMVAANAAGSAVFGFIIDRTLWEKKVTMERDDFRVELERKRTELNIARDIQMSFLPEKVPEIEGFEIAAMCAPASEVGGDFYDFIKMSDDRLGIVIADVSGKSVSGALFMALSRSVLRSNALWDADVRSVVGKTNSAIAEDSKSGMFVTLFYGSLDIKASTLTYVNAGHNPPILVDGAGSLSMLKTGGIALGAVEDARYEAARIKLISGSVLVLYTDGLTEAGSDELFGEERLVRTILESRDRPAKEILGHIQGAVAAFSAGRLADDMTIVVMKVI